MYIPEKMKITDKNDSHQFIKNHGFATIVSKTLNATHLPFLLDENEGEHGTLYCHFARANPHWQQLENNDALVIFNGPHAYISPTWYAGKPNVPTWNYAAVHVYGTFELLDDEQTLAVVNNTIAKYEPQLLKQDDIIPADYRDKLLKGIVGGKITINEIAGKYKLGQHRKAEDQQGVVKGLAQCQDQDSAALLSFMQQVNVGLGES
ncbi:FMN-binding negative transcriptional regulator [Colwelliaceae bacterium 6471]